ncbi:MAG TPA: hypothetical protein VF803_01090 [Candidatus Paceibacterota bacterium]
MAIHIVVTGDELTRSQRYILSRTLRHAAATALPGMSIRVVVKTPLVKSASGTVPLSTALKDLHGLSDVIVNRLAAAGILTVGDLMLRGSETSVLEIPGIGRRQLHIIIRTLAAHGRRLTD